MTKQEAIQAMQEGKKVTHDYFSDKEWATMVNGIILLEDGVQCPPNEFWRWRASRGWDYGWSLFN